MKILAFAVFVIFLHSPFINGDKTFTIPADKRAALEAIIDQCREQVNLSPEMLNKIRHCKHGNVDVEENVKCFYECTLSKVGFFIDGVIQPTKIAKVLGPIIGMDKLNDIMAKCNNLTTGGSICDTVFNKYDCYCKNRVEVD
ncbi:general odorant-binding protein 56d-like [Musca domestica]|uniref:General odorant-binding protein 56d-like n=1 Tax=Musca domestica TaxID=7370 RepID=A0ABM3VCN6_MUSDO|nr:general odorant-binding protein 56d-like [Musca domestica]